MKLKSWEWKASRKDRVSLQESRDGNSLENSSSWASAKEGNELVKETENMFGEVRGKMGLVECY